MTDKLYNIAGLSTFGKITKVRFANGKLEARTKVLERNGHTNIRLVALPMSMSKEAIVSYLKEQGFEVEASKQKIVKVAETVVEAPKAAKRTVKNVKATAPAAEEPVEKAS